MSGQDIKDALTKQIAEDLFPEWFEFKAIAHRLERAQDKRVELLKAEPFWTKDPSHDMLHEMIRASDLVTEIEAFESQQAGRVENIERAIRDAEAMIDDIQEGKQRVLVEALQQGRRIPAGNLDWERSTVSGETSSDDSDLEDAIALAKKNIGNLREEFNMEAVINGKLRKLMLNFAIKAKMQGSEQQQWVKGTQTQEYLRLNRSVLPVAEEQMRKFWVNSFRIAYKEAEEEKKKKKGKEAVKSSKLEQTSLQFQIEEVGKDTKVSKKIDSPSTVPTSPQKSTDWDWTTDNRFCFTCNKYGHTDKFCYVLDFPTDHGHQATRGNQDIDSDDESVFVNMEETPKAKKVNFCNHCQKWGHAAEMCKEIFPEEEEPDFCRVCNRDGHIEENCWRLHPELKAEHDAKARELKKKQLCTGCGNMGHLRRWCYKLHPELQPGFYA